MSEQKMSEQVKQREEHLAWLKRKSETARRHFDIQILGRSTQSEELMTVESNTEANENTKKAKNKPTTNQDINLQQLFEDMERIIQ